MKKYFLLLLLCLTSNYVFADESSQALAYYKQGKFLEAKETIEQTKKKDSPKFWYYRGIIFHELFKNEILSDNVEILFKEAVTSYNEVEKFKHPRFASYAKNNLNELFRFLMQRGNSYIKMKNYKDALIFFQRANEIEKDNGETLKNIAITHQKLGNNKKALEIYKNQKSNNILFACNQVEILLKEKKNVRALKLAKQLLDEHPYNVACLEVFHFYLSKQNKKSHKKICDETLSREEHIKNYQQAVLAKLQNDFATAYANFFQLYENAHDDKILIQLCDVAYSYSQQLILNSNDNINDEEKYNLAQDILEKTIFFTEKLFKCYSNNINVMEHLYKLYQQSDQQEKIDDIKSHIIRLGCGYIFEE
ncbi:MAG: hypothetical protein LBD32_01400 [Cytophagales bacterium]|nr:hypothetical protein [Cytophagales bacterium]